MHKKRLSQEPVLITGVSGFLGFHLANLLVKEGASVVGLVRDFDKDGLSRFEHISLGKKITVCQGDVVDVDRMREIVAGHNIKYIFHCAAHSIVQQCANDPIGTFRSNVLGTASILEAARIVPGVCGIMVMESDKSYGSFNTHDLPYKEEDALRPRGIYEASKACAGFVALSYAHNFDLPVFTVRAANLYGPGDPNTTRIIPNSILRILAGKPPVLYGAVAEYIREFLYVEDAATMMVDLMKSIDEVKGEAWNIGSGEKYRIKDVMAMLCDTLDTDLVPEIINKPSTFKEIPEQYLDLTKIKSHLPHFSPRTFKQGIPPTIAWYRKEYEQGRMHHMK